MGKTGINYGTKSWNVMKGCSAVSSGCMHCWARRTANRLAGRAYGYDRHRPFTLTIFPNKMDEPRTWRRPQTVLVAFMGDLFHPEVPFTFQLRALNVMRECPQHRFLLLTKRIEQAREVLGSRLLGCPNVWIGTSMESQPYDWRVDVLLTIPAHHRWVSYEPAIGPLVWKWGGGPGRIDWIVAGPETGRGARECKAGWIREVWGEAKKWKVPFFLKKAPAGWKGEVSRVLPWTHSAGRIGHRA